MQIAGVNVVDLKAFVNGNPVFHRRTTAANHAGFWEKMGIYSTIRQYSKTAWIKFSSFADSILTVIPPFHYSMKAFLHRL